MVPTEGPYKLLERGFRGYFVFTIWWLWSRVGLWLQKRIPVAEPAPPAEEPFKPLQHEPRVVRKLLDELLRAPVPQATEMKAVELDASTSGPVMQGLAREMAKTNRSMRYKAARSTFFAQDAEEEQ